ncbi:MAG: saccharopine dehydrogenase NADP-binding domain-containing protein [Proteobacteria bacterium]|nr:saccharopine dehydrogenase NADP-binding domain-containing protein [Pseudomonadota bacterium]
MRNLVVFGAGKIGVMIADFLHGTGDYDLTVVDSNPAAIERIAVKGINGIVASVEDAAARRRLIDGQHIAISALPYFANTGIGQTARECGVHYFDLTEDVETTRALRALADGADSAFVPQCGLAPGFISIVAHDLAQKFDSLDTVKMRVGALPKFPSNELKYNLTWSTDGLINEYCNPCEAIYDGERAEVRALEGYEHFSLDGIAYEAFNTSGGLGTLCETLEGKVRNLDYKTVRYPGHRDLIRMLARDLRLCERRELFLEVLENAVPVTTQDVVLVFVAVAGERDGVLTQESFARKIYSDEIDGVVRSAIQITTAAGICAMVDLLREGKLPQRGFVTQESARLDDFMNNRFGRYYRGED